LGSVYEWSNHYGIGRRAGLTDDEIVAIRDGASSTVLTAADRCVIRVVDEIFDDVVVSPTTLVQARDLLGNDKALLELVMIPGCYRTIGTVLLTFDIPLEDHVTPWPPDGRSPIDG